MKGYPVTAQEMQNLSDAGQEANRFYGLSGALFGFGVGLAKDILMAGTEHVAPWVLLASCSVAGSIFAFWHATTVKTRGADQLKQIMEETEHDD